MNSRIFIPSVYRENLAVATARGIAACEISTEKRGTLLDVQLQLPKSDLKPHHEEIRQFAEAVRNNHPVPVPPEQSLAVVEMLDAMYKSSRTGREVRLA